MATSSVKNGTAPFAGAWTAGEEHEIKKTFYGPYQLSITLRGPFSGILSSDSQKINEFVLWLIDTLKCWPHPEAPRGDREHNYPSYREREYAELRSKAGAAPAK